MTGLRGQEPGGQVLRRYAVPAFILGLFVCLAPIYSLTTPLFEAPDESTHYAFIQHLLSGSGLPVQRPGVQTAWSQEGSQPPLYYALGALLTSRIDNRDLPALMRTNPHADIGFPGAQDNKNALIHTARESLPWQDAVLAVRMVRLLSLLLSTGTVLCTYLLALSLFPDRPFLAYVATAFNATLPMFLFISGSVNNDVLVTLLASVALVIMVRLLDRSAGRGWVLALGIIIGLACLSKLGALGLLPLAALALAFRYSVLSCRHAGQLPAIDDESGFRPGRVWWIHLRAWLADSMIILTAVALVAGWWYARNWRLYGEPFGLRTMLDIAGRRAVSPTLQDLWGEFGGFRASFWGLFGWFNVFMRPSWIYRALDLLVVVALGGLLTGAWRNRANARARAFTASPHFKPWAGLFLLTGKYTVCICWVLIVFASIIRWTTLTMASQGRLMFPAISAICVLLVAGLAEWAPVRLQPMVVGSLAGAMVVLALSVPFTSIRPAYQRPPIIALGDVPASARRVDFAYESKVRLLGYELESDHIRPGDMTGVTLYWLALIPMQEDYSISLQLYGWHQTLWQHDTYPGGGSFPTSQWSPGEVIVDHYVITPRRDVTGPAPVPAPLAVVLYRYDGMEKLPVTDREGRAVVFPLVARPTLESAREPLAIPHVLRRNFGGVIDLAGYDMAGGRVSPGGDVPLTLYWRVTGQPRRDYKIFVHLLDAQGRIVAQADAPPMDGAYPTSAWQVGEVLADGHRLAIPPDAKGAKYRIYVGLYDPDTGERLPVLDDQGRASDDRIPLADLEIVANP